MLLYFHEIASVAAIEESMKLHILQIWAPNMDNKKVVVAMDDAGKPIPK